MLAAPSDGTYRAVLEEDIRVSVEPKTANLDEAFHMHRIAQIFPANLLDIELCLSLSFFIMFGERRISRPTRHGAL